MRTVKVKSESTPHQRTRRKGRLAFTLFLAADGISVNSIAEINGQSYGTTYSQLRNAFFKVCPNIYRHVIETQVMRGVPAVEWLKVILDNSVQVKLHCLKSIEDASQLNG